MKENFDTLNQLLSDLAAGQDATTLIIDNPELAAEIEAAQWALTLSDVQIPADAARRSRNRVLARAMELQPEIQPRGGFFQRLSRFAFALILALVFFLSWNGLKIASAQALPGDQLYPAKLTLERLRLGLALNPQTHQKVEEEYQTRRIDEIVRLLALERVEFVQFFGKVEEQWDDYWMIEGIEIRLLPETIILGEIQPGMIVEIEGATQPEGWVQASEIHLQRFSFTGIVEQISKTAWIISGREIVIASDSLIDSDVHVGDLVIVEVESDDFGTLTLRSITPSGPESQELIVTETPLHPKNTLPIPTETVQPDETEEHDENDDSEKANDSAEDGESDEEDEPDEKDASDEDDEDDEDDDVKKSEKNEENDDADEDNAPDETDEP